jgi:hypothetical protein
LSDGEKTQKAKLNLETARVDWVELQRFFAQGSVIWVDNSLDLIDVAHDVAEDNSSTIRRWMEAGVLATVSDQQAKQWLAENARLWTVVVRPLLLVQEALNLPQ